jgi:signal transduction histidine kinase
MDRMYRHSVSRYGIALLTVALMLLQLRPLASLGYEFAWLFSAAVLMFLVAILFTTWAAGVEPGLLATFLSALIHDFFVLAPVDSEMIWLTDGMQLALLGMIAALVSFLCLFHRRQAEKLRRHVRRQVENLAILAHELRTPLSVAANTLHLLRLADPNGAAARVRGILERQVDQMTRLTDDMLEMSRLTHGKARLCKEPVDLAAIVEQTVESVSPLVDARRHRLEVTLPPEPIRLLADRTRVVQILVNLLTNAARYTEPGGLIWLVAERCMDRIWLRVRDSGIGLAPEALPHIFELFNQGEDGSRGGLGISLNVVRHLSVLHGGGVMAHSSGLGKGSEFAVWLPIEGLSTSQVSAVEAYMQSHTSKQVQTS